MKPRHRALPAAAAAATVLLLAGCAGPSAPPSWHSVLPPGGTGAASAAAPAGSASGTTVYVGRISVPEAIDRPSLVVGGDGRLAVLDGQRWIEPVKAQLPRALALLLADRLPGTAVAAWPATAGSAAAWRVGADVQRFELGTSPAEARLRVVWTLSAADTGTPALQVYDAVVPAAGSDSSALVAAMQMAVAQWADRVAAGVKARPPDAAAAR